MIALRGICVVLLCVQAAVATEDFDPLSDEFIDYINSKNISWRAGRNFPSHIPFSYIKSLLGALKDDHFATLPMVQHDDDLIASLPENFDPRDKWPNCPTLNDIRDQGSCGSCWALGAVEAMTDRYCIHSNGKHNFYLSAQDLASCCPDCSLTEGCEGGKAVKAWLYWNTTGIVSGGSYNSNQGCRPYEIPPCKHTNEPGNLPPCVKSVPTPQCVNSCESNYNTAYNEDKRRGKSVYRVSGEEQIKAELYKNGPVETTFKAFTDLVNYKEGVYHRVANNDMGLHAVKMLGWGVENGVKYWLIANSWNPGWGDKGFFKILRGENHCGIEEDIVAGEPLIE